MNGSDKPLSQRIQIPQDIALRGYPDFVDVRIVWRPVFYNAVKPILLSSGDPDWSVQQAMLSSVFTNEPWSEAEVIESLATTEPELWAWLLEQAQAAMKRPTTERLVKTLFIG